MEQVNKEQETARYDQPDNDACDICAAGPESLLHSIPYGIRVGLSIATHKFFQELLEPENWQVQELDGTSVSDHTTKQGAIIEMTRLTIDYQKSYRLRKTV